MSDFEITGGEQLGRLSKALREAGRTELRKEMNAALKQAVTSLIGDTRIEARRRLPKRGGLAKAVADAPQKLQVRTGRDMGVRIVVTDKKKAGAKAANAGLIRHPVFGNRDVWVEQKVTPGWFDDPFTKGAPKITPELKRAMDNVVNRIVAEVD